MTFFFHEDAEVEFDNAIAYYEECRPGLGLDFANEVYDTIRRIVQFPKAWTMVSPHARRCLVKRFPFGIIYRVRNDNVEIIAVADSRRRPDYWRNR